MGTSPYYVAVGDFNADGNLDLAVTSENCAFSGKDCPLGTISILFGNGDGTFQPRVDYVTATYALGIASADLNGTGAGHFASLGSADSPNLESKRARTAHSHETGHGTKTRLSSCLLLVFVPR